jgi:hypothetical protein
MIKTLTSPNPNILSCTAKYFLFLLPCHAYWRQEREGAGIEREKI